MRPQYRLAMNDPNRTLLGSPDSLHPNMDSNKTIMGRAPSLNTTITIKPIQCPVCKSFNPPGVMFCNDCGLIFEMALDLDAFGAPAVQLPVLLESSGRQHQLRPGSNMIGRAGTILIEDTRVSRQHCQVVLEGSDIYVEDLGSTNGTTVAGQKVIPGSRMTLNNGETISLGGLELILSLPGETNKTQQVLSGKTTAIFGQPTLSDTPAWLIVDGKESPLHLGMQSFGRKDNNDIVIPDPYVSGQHGTLEVTADGVFLVDIGSTNGTVLNEAKLSPNMRTKLDKNDVIRLGSLELTIRLKE